MKTREKGYAMRQIIFDFNNLISFNVGSRHGVTEAELAKASPASRSAYQHLMRILQDEPNRIRLNIEWAHLPFQDSSTVREVAKWGKEIACRFENVLFLGIGGSFLGLKAAQDALASPYYNDFADVRQGRPRIYFEGNNLDPDTLHILLRQLNPQRTFVVVISKSGETTETKAAFMVVETWLKKSVGKNYGRQIAAITDSHSGTLRKYIQSKHSGDPRSFRSLVFLKGVGGRFSELNMGILHLAVIGVDILEVLAGAQAMYKRCTRSDLYKNPALLYATLQTILYQKKGKAIAVMMPFCETLKSTADWYVQLLAESLGKKYARKILPAYNKGETWLPDLRRMVNVGRTPVSARGTNDLHSIQQNIIEGEPNKTVTFIRTERLKANIVIPGLDTDDILAGKEYTTLLKLAQEAVAWALVRESRPNCTVILPQITAYHWGELIFFLEMATAFEGELLNVNAFDQPGVEGYKNYLYYKLGRPGLPQGIERQIQSHPLAKKKKFLL